LGGDRGRSRYTLEVWVAAITGVGWPDTGGDLLHRHARASIAFTRLVRGIRDRGTWDDAFVDAPCEPPQSFTYGGVISHVLTYGAVRREALAGVLRVLGAPVRSSGDPVDWEASK
jgi:AraC family transcriptional regulator